MAEKGARVRIRTSIAGNSAQGFTYVMVLAAIVVVGILAEVATLATSRIVSADREAELLFRGLAYKAAIKSYYEAGKPTKSFPRSLAALLRDPRFPNKRHIRTLYSDPMGKEETEWTSIPASDGGIAGVASESQKEPLKKANFPEGLESFEGMTAYSEWIFEYKPTPPK